MPLYECHDRFSVGPGVFGWLGREVSGGGPDVEFCGLVVEVDDVFVAAFADFEDPESRKRGLLGVEVPVQDKVVEFSVPFLVPDVKALGLGWYTLSALLHNR